jgi:hypothetical protein
MNDAVVDKIRKCLNLANGKNATQGEMENAMAKAKEIALRHNIELASINLSEGRNASAGMEIGKEAAHTQSKCPSLPPLHLVGVA